MPLKHPLGFLVPHSRIFGASRCPVAESRDQGSFLKTAPTKILTTEVVRICRAPGEEIFLGLFRSRAACWMRHAWECLASPRTAAFTAHVTIHVHEFSPQILPKLTGMRMRSAREFRIFVPPTAGLCGSPPCFSRSRSGLDVFLYTIFYLNKRNAYFDYVT